jgi:hypothetical protein
LCELLHVCLARGVVENGVLVRVHGLGLMRLVRLHNIKECSESSNLFQLVHQVGRIAENIFVTSVKFLCENLIDDPVLA